VSGKAARAARKGRVISAIRRAVNACYLGRRDRHIMRVLKRHARAYAKGRRSDGGA
jgi:hypothetical protein